MMKMQMYYFTLRHSSWLHLIRYCCPKSFQCKLFLNTKMFPVVLALCFKHLVKLAMHLSTNFNVRKHQVRELVECVIIAMTNEAKIAPSIVTAQ